MEPITYLPAVVTRSSYRGGPGAIYKSVSKSKQKAPFVPAAYHSEQYTTLFGGTYTSKNLPSYWSSYVHPGYCTNFFAVDAYALDGCVLQPGFFTAPQSAPWTNMGNYRQQALNKASAKFDEVLRTSAETWTTFHERKQALQSFDRLAKTFEGFGSTLLKLTLLSLSPKQAASSLAKSLHQLARNGQVGLANTVRAFRNVPLGTLKKRFRKAINRWTERLKSGIGNFADIWLELNFGWIPLVKDTGAIISLLVDPMPDGAVTASTRVFGQGAGTCHIESHYATRAWTGTWYVKVGASILSVNKKLFTADTAGFANPFLVAWQLMPFSFLLDWITNVSQFIRSWTGILGIQLGDVYTTVYGKAKMSGGWYERDSRGTIYAFAKANSEAFYMDRSLTLPAVKFQSRELNFGPLKAITSWALLVQQLRKFHT